MMLTSEWITSVSEFKKKRNEKLIDREKDRSVSLYSKKNSFSLLAIYIEIKMSKSRFIILFFWIKLSNCLFVFFYFKELTGGDGDKKDGGNDEEDPEVK